MTDLERLRGELSEAKRALADAQKLFQRRCDAVDALTREIMTMERRRAKEMIGTYA